MSDVPKNWNVYSRYDADGLWVGEHTGSEGIDFRLSAATQDDLMLKIEAWRSVRAANGNPETTKPRSLNRTQSNEREQKIR